MGNAQTGNYLYPVAQIDGMIKFGKNLDINLDVIYGLISKAHRIKKQVPLVNDVNAWFTNYANYLNHGIPYAFKASNDFPSAAAHFNQFKIEAGPLFSDFWLGNRVWIGGSALTKTSPGDLDLALYFSKSEFSTFVSKMKNELNKLENFVENNPMHPKSNGFEKDIDYIDKYITRANNKKKVDIGMIIRFDMIDDAPVLRKFVNEFRDCSYNNSLNVTTPSKYKTTLKIFEGKVNDVSITLPPHAEITF